MDKRTELIISDILKDLGITPALKGYEYLRCAIGLTIENPDIVHHVIKELYPKVASLYNTTASRAERAMRTAIEAAWPSYYLPIWEVVFKQTIKESKGKPTNSMFIATVADYLLTTRSDINGSK